MPWQKSAADRARDQATYGDPVYKRNRKTCLAKANGRCQRCGRRARLQCDHITPVSQGGGHDLANLLAICEACHKRKTAQEGGGFRSTAPRDPPAQPRTAW